MKLNYLEIGPQFFLIDENSLNLQYFNQLSVNCSYTILLFLDILEQFYHY